jgi:hypothetical protein
LTLRSQAPCRSDSALRVTVDLQPATGAGWIEEDLMDQTPTWRKRSARWAAAAAILAAGALGGGILGATLSASVDPVATPSTQASSPTQDTTASSRSGRTPTASSRSGRTPTASSRSDEEGASCEPFTLDTLSAGLDRRSLSD